MKVDILSSEKDILFKILLSREKRAEKQKYLINKYKCSLISFTLNIPGATKDSELYRKIHKEGIKEILRVLNNEHLPILYKEEIYEITGAECYICINVDVLKLKELMVTIEENHELGRIFDIDVFDSNFKIIKRKKIYLKERKCFICNDDAIVCRRNNKHTTEELLKKINVMASDFFMEQSK